MSSKNPNFSVTAGSRSYRFDVKTSVDGARYLIIREQREGHRVGQIMIFQDHFLAFRAGLRKALRLTKHDQQNKAYDLDRIRRIYPNAYVGWEQENDNRLTNLYSQNKTIEELAKIFQRKPSAIRSRLKKLKLLG